jgi:hypothetical protein
MDMLPANRRRVLLVEWVGVTWPDLLPRLQAGHLPALRTVVASGVYATLAPCPADRWPLSRSLGLLAEAGVEMAAPIPANLPAEARVLADDLDPTLLQQFPADTEAQSILTSALCSLYEMHNEIVVQLGAASLRLVVARHDFLAQVDAAYARSSSLPQARRMAFQLLDLLLHDLRHQAGSGAAIVVCSSGLPGRSGFCLHAVPGDPASKLPRLPATEMLPTFLANLLELTVPAGSPLASPMPLTAAWLQPDIVPSARHAVTGESSVTAGEFDLRESSPADHHQLLTVFPGIPWETAAICYLASKSGSSGVLAAAAVQSDGGILFATRSDHATTTLVISKLLADPRVRSMDKLFNSSEAPANSLVATALQAAGFVVTQTLDLWLTETSAMLERTRTMTWAHDASWQLRPATAADVDLWRTRPESASLLRPGTSFDPDLSWAAELAGHPAGLLLLERIAGSPAYVNMLAVAAEARAAGGFALLLSQISTGLQLAGIRQIVFTTDQTRREIIAFARRCRSRRIRQTLRLQRQQPSRK